MKGYGCVGWARWKPCEHACFAGKKEGKAIYACVRFLWQLFGGDFGKVPEGFWESSGRDRLGWTGLGGWADPAGLAGSAAISGVSTCSQVTSDLQWLWNAFLLCLWFRCGLVSGFDLYLGSENQLPVPTQLWSQCPAAPLKKAAMTGLLGASGWVGWGAWGAWGAWGVCKVGCGAWGEVRGLQGVACVGWARWNSFKPIFCAGKQRR